jgi:hypothetical protein
MSRTAPAARSLVRAVPAASGIQRVQDVQPDHLHASGDARFDFYYYAATNTLQFVIAIVDPLLSAIVLGIGGAVIAAVLARIPKTAGLRPAE